MATKKKGQPPTRKLILELGRKQHHRDGELEIDDNAKVSESEDNGAYLQAWVWVDFAGTPLDKEPDPEDSISEGDESGS